MSKSSMENLLILTEYEAASNNWTHLEKIIDKNLPCKIYQQSLLLLWKLDYAILFVID